MSTAQTWRFISNSPTETLELAAAIGRELRGSEVIELVSDLGGGKTTFVRGLARGLGSRDAVRSPSFTLANRYEGDKLTLYHLDLYRLEEAGVIGDELDEYMAEPNSVVVVEWPGLVEDLLPDNRLLISIRPLGETKREFNFTYQSNLKHLFPINT